LRHEKSAAVILKDFWAASVHDITIFKNECSWINFRGKRIHVDLGFQGMKVIICNGCVIMPHKKRKGKLLAKYRVM
jgi:hypothetical protein